MSAFCLGSCFCENTALVGNKQAPGLEMDWAHVQYLHYQEAWESQNPMPFCILLVLWTDTAIEPVLTTLGYSLV